MICLGQLEASIKVMWPIRIPESVPEVEGDGDREQELEREEDGGADLEILDHIQNWGEVAWK